MRIAWIGLVLASFVATAAAQKTLPELLGEMLRGSKAAATALAQRGQLALKMAVGAARERSVQTDTGSLALQGLGPADAWAVAPLAILVCDRSSAHRSSAAAALLRIGSASKAATNMLEAAREQDRGLVIANLLGELAKIPSDPVAATKVPAAKRRPPADTLVRRALVGDAQSWPAAATLLSRGRAEQLLFAERLMEKMVEGTKESRDHAHMLLVAVRCVAACDAVVDRSVLRLLPLQALRDEAVLVALRGLNFVPDEALEWLLGHGDEHVRGVAILAYGMPPAHARTMHIRRPDVDRRLAELSRAEDPAARRRALLVAALRGLEVRAAATRALPNLLKQLDRPTSSNEFRSACFRLQAFGPAAAPAADKLIARLRIAKGLARNPIIAALQGIGAVAAEKLIAAAGEKDGDLRVVVMQILARSSDFDAATAKQMLLSIGEETTEDVIRGQFGSLTKDKVALFVPLMDDPALRPAMVDVLSASTLYWLESLPRFAKGLTAQLPRADERQRAKIIALLGRAGAAAVPTLIKLLDDAEPGARAGAARALGKSRATQAVPALIRLVIDPDPGVQGAVIQALGQLGAGDDERTKQKVKDAILEQWGVLDVVARRFAIWTLAGMGIRDDAVIKVVSESLASEDRALVVQAVAASLRLPPVLEQAEKWLQRAFASKDVEERMAAIEGVWRSGVKGAPYVDRMIGFLDDSEAQVVAFSLRVLRNLGPAAAKALPRLRKMVNDRRHGSQARFAIQRITGRR